MLKIKRAHTEDLRDAVYSLRYQAYRREGAIDELQGERFEDKYDQQPNHVLWALCDQERVVGSIRTTWFDPSEPSLRIPEMDGYAEDLPKFVPADVRLVSGNRFVTDPDRKDRDSSYALLLLRHYMVVAHQKAGFSLAAVRANHLPFYRRVLKLERVSEPKLYPGLKSMMYLTACDFEANIERVYSKTPVLRPRGYEGVFLDETCREVWEDGIPVET